MSQLRRQASQLGIRGSYTEFPSNENKECMSDKHIRAYTLKHAVTCVMLHYITLHDRHIYIYECVKAGSKMSSLAAAPTKA